MSDASLVLTAQEMLNELKLLSNMVNECDECSGSGLEPGTTADACRHCGGVGSVLYAHGEIGCIRALIAKAEGEE